MRTLGSLLGELPTAPAGTFLVRRLAPTSPYYAGRNSDGCAAILVQTIDDTRTVPLQLAGIEARFAVACRVSEPHADAETKTLTVIVCHSRDPAVEGYFATIIESLVANLGPIPSTDGIGEAVGHLAALFQKLQSPAKRPLAGLIGELCYLLSAAEPLVAIAAWRADTHERFDFVSGNIRLDVKTSTKRERRHDISFEQANSPPGTLSLFASLWVEPTAGGTSLAELLVRIEERIGGSPSAVSKVRSVVADTLGNSLPLALDWRFDFSLAASSLLIFDAQTVPAIRGELPPGVSAVRQVSDFSTVAPLAFSRGKHEGGELLPAARAQP